MEVERIIKALRQISVLLMLINLVALPASAQVTFMLLDAPGQPDQAAFSLSRDGSDMGCILDGAVYWWTAEGGFRFLDAGSPLISRVGMAGSGQSMVATRKVADGLAAAIWKHDKTSETLATPDFDCPGSSTDCRGFDLSEWGSVVVGSTMTCDTDLGFAWNSKTGLAILGAKTEDNSSGLAVSANGSIVVGFSSNPPKKNPCPTLWTAEELPILPLGADAIGQALNISLNGRFIVGTANLHHPATRGFIWTEAEGCQFFETLKGRPADPSRATAVSDQGVVVGWSGDELFGDQEAFIWDKVSGLRPLNKVLEDNGGNIPSGLVLQAALDISGDGKTIVGLGRDRNYRRAIWMVQLENSDALGSNLVPPTAQNKPLQPEHRDSLKINKANMMMSFPFGKNARHNIPRQQ